MEVLCSLVQKITGVLLSDQKDVMLHLIRSGIADLEPAKRYVIRVSPEDMPRKQGWGLPLKCRKKKDWERMNV